MKKTLIVTALLVGILTTFSGIAGATEVNEVKTVGEVKIMGLPYVPM